MICRRFTLAFLLACDLTAPASGWAQGVLEAAGPGLAAYRIVDDTIPEPLSAVPGDAGRGRAIVADRSLGLCLLCHAAPIPEERFQGDIAPPLHGAGERWSPGQLRLRVVNGRRLNPSSIMPTYHAVAGRVRVGSAWRDKPLLSAQQIEDVVAYLQTLRG